MVVWFLGCCAFWFSDVADCWWFGGCCLVVLVGYYFVVFVVWLPCGACVSGFGVIWWLI